MVERYYINLTNTLKGLELNSLYKIYIVINIVCMQRLVVMLSKLTDKVILVPKYGGVKIRHYCRNFISSVFSPDLDGACVFCFSYVVVKTLHWLSDLWHVLDVEIAEGHRASCCGHSGVFSANGLVVCGRSSAAQEGRSFQMEVFLYMCPGF